MPAENVVGDILNEEDYPDGEIINIQFNIFAKNFLS